MLFKAWETGIRIGSCFNGEEYKKRLESGLIVLGRRKGT